MKHSALALLVVSSLLAASAAHAATRPRYGGTLRVTTAAAPSSLDPVELAASGSLSGSNLSSLIFDTLVTLDARGRTQPGLAISWQPEPGNQRWLFRLRRGVNFQDGTPLTADQVAASLRFANPTWKISATGDAVVIERDSPLTQSGGWNLLWLAAQSPSAAEHSCSGPDHFSSSNGHPGKHWYLPRTTIAGPDGLSSTQSKSRWGRDGASKLWLSISAKPI